MAYELRPAERSEGWLFYNTDSEGEQRHGAIGMMRADFGRSGKEFWTTFVTARKKRGKISRKKREPEEAEGREEKQAQRAYKREAKLASLLRGG
jgi:hypothetical protein